MYINDVRPCLSKYPDKGTPVAAILLILSLLFPGSLLHAQQDPEGGSDGAEWFGAFPQKTLFVVFPTFTVKHERIRRAVANLDEQASGRRHAEQTVSRDVAYRDSLMVALAASFRQAYELNPVYLMPDTSYVRWTRGDLAVTILDLDLQPTRKAWSAGEIGILRKSRSSRETGTGVEQWMLIPPAGVVLPKKVPQVFREGSIGVRFVRFFEAFFSFSHRPDRVEELRVGTDYLARQAQKKWARYLEKSGQ
ncbi:MAG: hypothetical protein R2787_15845 [Saprospiraceae bacterium]